MRTFLTAVSGMVHGEKLDGEGAVSFEATERTENVLLGARIEELTAARALVNAHKAMQWSQDDLGYRGEVTRRGRRVEALAPLTPTLVGHLALTTESGGPMNGVRPSRDVVTADMPVSVLARAFAATWHEIELARYS